MYYNDAFEIAHLNTCASGLARNCTFPESYNQMHPVAKHVISFANDGEDHCVFEQVDNIRIGRNAEDQSRIVAQIYIHR